MCGRVPVVRSIESSAHLCSGVVAKWSAPEDETGHRYVIAAAIDSRGVRDVADLNARWFTGLTVTDGAGSKKAGNYAGYTDENFRRIRAKEQHMSAGIGKYSAQIQLELTSGEVKEKRKGVAAKLARLIGEIGPEVIYTHSLADRHETHAAVTLCVIEALRSLKPKERTKKLYGMEIWGSLD